MAAPSVRHPGRHPARPAPRRRAGFTLVEVLVALLVLAILAGLAWQGLDGIVRARDGNQAALERTLRLNTVVAQWEQDLLAVHDVGVVPAIAFDGQTLRLTRRSEGGMALVAWSVRGGVWQRWAGPSLTRVGELQEGWLRSLQFLGHEPGHLTVAEASAWQIYFFRGNAWSNAQSTGDVVLPPAAAGGAAPAAAGAAPAAAREALPDAVRLVITLAAGVLTRDIALAPGGS